MIYPTSHLLIHAATKHMTGLVMSRHATTSLKIWIPSSAATWCGVFLLLSGKSSTSSTRKSFRYLDAILTSYLRKAKTRMRGASKGDKEESSIGGSRASQ